MAAKTEPVKPFIVETDDGVKVNSYESLAQAQTAAEAKDQQAIALDVSSRYVAKQNPDFKG